MTHILLVDDFRGIRALGARILRAGGYTVSEAQDGAEALEQIQREGARIDLLISDIRLPDLSGIDLAVRLRESHPDARILFATGHVPDSMESLPFTDRIGVLAKPFGANELLERVRDILGDIRPSA